MSRMACLMAGRVGPGGGSPILFSAGRFDATGLEEGVGDHGHQCVSADPCPGSAFERAAQIRKPQIKLSPQSDQRSMHGSRLLPSSAAYDPVCFANCAREAALCQSDAQTNAYWMQSATSHDDEVRT